MRACMRACVCVCEGVCVNVSVSVCVHASVYVCMHVSEYYFRCVKVLSKVVCIQALKVDILYLSILTG